MIYRVRLARTVVTKLGCCYCCRDCRKDFERLGWDSIGGQDATKLALQQALEWPLKFPQTFTRLGVKPPRGILLYGPPGCSKSTIVRAAAHSSGATFLTLSAAKVFSPFFGDAEAAVRQVFRDARAALPAIVFFDEIDVLVAKRQFDGSSDSGSGSSSAMRVMSTMLNEMDGVESADGMSRLNIYLNRLARHSSDNFITFRTNS